MYSKYRQLALPFTFSRSHQFTFSRWFSRWAIETRQLAARMLQIYCIPKITQIFFKINSKISSLVSLVIKYRTGRDCWGRFTEDDEIGGINLILQIGIGDNM